VKQAVRRGFTLIEMLVVIVIIGIIASMLLPAINGAREQSRRSRCSANMKQIGLAILNFEANKGMLPSGGEGTQFVTTSGAITGTATEFDETVGQGLFVEILPYMDRMDLVNQYDMNKRYNDSTTGGTLAAPLGNWLVAHTIIDSYLCPSDPYPAADSQGCGRLDYFATVYTDIIPDAGVSAPPGRAHNGATRMNGAMAVPACPLGAITDGASNTIFCIEDAGRTDQPYGGQAGTQGALSNYSYTKEIGSTGVVGTLFNPDGTSFSNIDNATGCAPGANASTNCHGVWRWADQDAGGSGISGQNDDSTKWGAGEPSRVKFINGNNTPKGGPSTCPWNHNNCGPNDEPFSFHPGGCNAVFGDGSVHFLSDNMDGRTLRYMVTRSEGIPFTTQVANAGGQLVTPTSFVGN
jgi:prepilin-type N-terminal cleavage/methylation domain-containing protein/prepilin-type processing-associated H-X9-DG protein